MATFPLFPMESNPTSSRPASPVSPTRAPGSNWARRMTELSGRSLSMSFVAPNPIWSLLKTLLDSSVWRSTACYLTWNRKATKQGRSYFQLAPSTPRTGGKGSGLWRTPDASIVTGGAANGEDRKRQGHAIGLHDQANTPSMWPTPRAMPGNFSRVNGKIYETSLQSMARRGLLQEQKEQLFPTPTANRWDGLQSHGVNVVEGSLNPAWVERLMGYPDGWTDLSGVAQATGTETGSVESPASPEA